VQTEKTGIGKRRPRRRTKRARAWDFRQTKPLQFFPSSGIHCPPPPSKKPQDLISRTRKTSSPHTTSYQRRHKYTLPSTSEIARFDQGETDFQSSSLVKTHTRPFTTAPRATRAQFFVQRNSARLPSLSTTHNATFAHRPNHCYKLLRKR
jgi:hypothetical protein